MFWPGSALRWRRQEARAGARVHLRGWVACARSLRRRIVCYGPIVRRGGVGGKGERRALHELIVLTRYSWVVGWYVVRVA